MPCSDGRDGRIVYIENLEKVDGLTRMLCSLCKVVDKHNECFTSLQALSMPNNIAKWWEEHKEQDRVRTERAKVKAETVKKKKKLRRSGLSKLNDEERTALGLEKRR